MLYQIYSVSIFSHINFASGCESNEAVPLQLKSFRHSLLILLRGHYIVSPHLTLAHNGLDCIITERMQLHYTAQAQNLDQQKEFDVLEEQVQQILKQLSPEKVQAVTAYVDWLAEKTAADNELFYKAGVSDGIRLCLAIHKICK